MGMVAVNTTLAACAGGCGAMLLAWIIFGKHDFAMVLNGVLAGLVGITTNADGVDNMESIIIGLVAGLLVVIATIAQEEMKIDNPVGAFPVHGVCGMWALIAIPIFCDYGASEVTLADGTTKEVIFGTWTAKLTTLGFLVVRILRVTSLEEVKVWISSSTECTLISTRPVRIAEPAAWTACRFEQLTARADRKSAYELD